MAVLSLHIRRICRRICVISHHLVRVRRAQQLPVFVFRSMEGKTVSRLFLLEIYNVQHILQPRLHDETGNHIASGAYVRMECSDLQSCRLMPERSDQLLPERVGHFPEEASLTSRGFQHICLGGPYMTCLRQKDAAERAHMQLLLRS